MTTQARTDRPIRALFCDLDGTLIGPDERVSPRVANAVAQARAVGCEVVLCTGRARFSTLPIAAQLPPPLGYAVTSNGGVITHLGTGETILRRLMPAATAVEIARAMFDAGAQPYIYEDTPLDGPEHNRVLYHPARPVGVWASPPRYVPHDNLLEHIPFEPVSVSTFAPEETIRPLTRLLRERFGDALSFIEVGTHRNWGVEVYAQGVSKQLGLETIAARLDIERSEIMAIGDHINDVEMLRWAGIGVAMQNGIPEVHEAADYITGSVQEDGVAQAIERFIL